MIACGVYRYAMIIASDPSVQPASILINIEASRPHFESLIANMSNAANNAQAGAADGVSTELRSGWLRFAAGGRRRGGGCGLCAGDGAST